MDYSRLLGEVPSLVKELEQMQQTIKEVYPDLDAQQRMVLCLLLFIAELRARQ